MRDSLAERFSALISSLLSGVQGAEPPVGGAWGVSPQITKNTGREPSPKAARDVALLSDCIHARSIAMSTSPAERQTEEWPFS